MHAPSTTLMPGIHVLSTASVVATTPRAQPVLQLPLLTHLGRCARRAHLPPPSPVAALSMSSRSLLTSSLSSRRLSWYWGWGGVGGGVGHSRGEFSSGGFLVLGLKLIGEKLRVQMLLLRARNFHTHPSRPTPPPQLR